MGSRTSILTEDHIRFIRDQKIFFVGTATETGHINVSPKGMDSFVVLANNRVAWLNVTGSGNETAAHIQVCPRMTIMFCAFEGKPLIMRLYGTATAIHRAAPEWNMLYSQFAPLPGARQIFDVAVEMVLTSCGMAVPLYDYAGERELLNEWAVAKGDDGIRQYWEKKNQTSLDGRPTNILEKSG